jgi:FMN phosphatase YigB (HAD superfamily)
MLSAAKTRYGNAPPIETRLREMLWRRMYRELPLNETIHTVSFDVFDTLITRPWFHPFDQFAAIAPQLRQLGLCSMSDLEWMNLRIESECAARKRTSHEDVSLQDIYSVITERLGWTPQQSSQACDLEFQQELRDIKPIAHAQKRLKEARAAGKDVIATSDTYLSAAQLALLLERCGYDLLSDDIFSSSDHGLTKGTGRLFSKILERRKLRSHQLYHVGDQAVPDGRAPANLGIRSVISADYLPTRYERLLAEADEDNFLIWSAVGGGARASRLARTFGYPHQQTLWNVGCDVAGPLLFSYVLWVLTRARSQGIDRLYFLARDGEALLTIAHRICRWLGWSIDCRYLYASRRSFCLPALIEFDQDASDWALSWWETPAIRSVLSELTGNGLLRSDWDRPLTPRDLKRLHRILKDVGVSERILAIAREQRAVLIDYLRQEGLADGTNWALCDVGWRGTTQLCLSRITANSAEFPRAFKGFYFGLNRKDLFIPVEQAEAFYASDAGFVSKFGWLVETFCWTDQGGVERFSRDSSGVAKPILAEAQDTGQIKWGSRIQRAAIMSFADSLIEALNFGIGSADQFTEAFGQKAMASFELMRTHPSLNEAEAYGSIAIDYDIGHKRKIVVGPVIRPDRLLLWLALRHRSGVARLWWPEGAIRRSVRSNVLRVILHVIHHARVLWDRVRGRVPS